MFTSNDLRLAKARQADLLRAAERDRRGTKASRAGSIKAALLLTLGGLILIALLVAQYM